MRLVLLALLPGLVMAQIQTSSVLISSKINSDKSTFSNASEVIEEFSGDSTGLLIQKLAQVPGVFINQSGRPASQATIHIRGSEFRHVLVLVDGVRVNDPSTTSKEANINALNVGDIARVEIIKGTQSLLYGTDAIGGIVNIITKDKLEHNSVTVMKGFSNMANWAQGFRAGKLSGVLNYQYDESEGISSLRKGSEDDAYVNRNLHMKLNYAWKDDLKSELLIKDNNQYTEYDNSQTDEKDNYAKSQQSIYSHKLIGKSDAFEWSFRNSYNRTDRPNISTNGNYLYEGIEQTNEAIVTKDLGGNKVLVGIENINEQFTQTSVEREFAYLNSLYFLYDWKKGDYFGQVGMRGSSHKTFGDFYSPGASLGKKIGENILSANIQRGFKAPSLYQMYGVNETFNKEENLDLEPESSWAYDLNYQLGNRFNASVFYTKIDNVILNNATPENGEYLEISGVEGKYDWRSENSLTSFSLGLFQYFNPEKKYTYKRPNERAVIDHIHFIGDSGEFNFNFQFVGRRYDQNFNTSPTADVKLGAYELVNISYKHHFDNKEVVIGIDNVFNEFYESAFEYGTLGQTAYLKFKYMY